VPSKKPVNARTLQMESRHFIGPRLREAEDSISSFNFIARVHCPFVGGKNIVD